MKSLPTKPAGFIFDMDGTLLDTEPLYTVATQKTVDPFEVEYTLALKKRCMGGDSTRSAQIVIDHYALPLSAAEFLNNREVYLEELFKDVEEIGGVPQFLNKLIASKLTMGLATSSHKHLVDLKLAKKSWRPVFNTVVCGDDPELKQGKPNPDIFLLCAKRLNLDPENCIAFEDSPTGIKAARAAGMAVIAINSPFVDADGFGEASLVIDHYDELDALLAKWQSN